MTHYATPLLNLAHGTADGEFRCMEIVFATGNKNKLKEVNEIAEGSNVTFILPPPSFSPSETGKTFEENSYIKAFEAAKLSGAMSLADDSGLCVETLNGAPGLYSARYAETQELRIQKLLKELDGITNRNAYFICAMTLTAPDGKIIHQTTGYCRGKIAFTPAGNNGFGYDPIFVPDSYKITLAQFSDAEKNKLSHRGNALREMLAYITASF